MDRVDKIVKKIKDRADIAIVLGSGFGDALPKLSNVHEVTYNSLGIKYNYVEGHSRKFVFGDFDNKRILVFNRLHYYESGNLDNIRLLYKIISKLGVKLILMSTASGAVNKSFKPTDIVLIHDHINLTGQNPLIAEKPIRFIDLKDVYDKEILEIAKKVSAEYSLELKEGVHAQLTGPTYETPAEIKMLRALGVDTVSMSPVLDVLQAYSLNMKVFLVAGVTNKAADIGEEPITHEEVLKNGKLMSAKLKTLFEEMLKRINFWCIKYKKCKKLTLNNKNSRWVVKKLLITICCVLCICIIPLSGITQANFVYADEPITAKSSILIDYSSGEVLEENNADEKLPIASMVKMMTLLLTFEEMDKGNLALDTKITTTENASGMGGSQVFIDPYVTYSAEQMIKSVIMASANDASVALAEHISGSEDTFVKKMNERAKNLGMMNTLYANCTGLPEPEQYSSARDVSTLMKELLKHDIYFKYSTIWMDELVHPSGRKTELVNTNKLTRYYKGCDAGKTGSTSEAGYCLCASAKRGDMRLISVVIGAKTGQDRFNESASLFNYGFANFENKNIVSSEMPLGKIEVKKAKINETDYYAEKSYYGLCKKGEGDAFKTEINIDESVSAPIKAGDKIGTLTVIKDGQVKEEINLIIKEDIKALSYKDSIKKVISKW